MTHYGDITKIRGGRMSILIKGMDVPKDGRYTMCVTHGDDGKPHIVIQNQDTLEFIKHGGVVEVPTPHGRLIDVDAAKECLNEIVDCELAGCNDKNCSLALLEWAVSKRTVIEAEVEE